MPKQNTVKVTLSYKDEHIGNTPYRIEKVVNDIGVQVERKRNYVGDFLTEAQASELLSEPSLEVTTVARA